MKQIVVFPRGSLTPKDRERMTRQGLCAIEADDPKKVVLLRPVLAADSDMIAMSALHAMSGTGICTVSEIRGYFGAELIRRLKLREVEGEK